MSRYDDIIDLPHNVSDTHPQRLIIDRAAQLSPFAAPTGYGDTINETAKATEEQIELDDSERQEIDRILRKSYEKGITF